MKKFIFFAFLFFISCSKGEKAKQEVAMADIRNPAVAGSWYPGDKQSLTTMVRQFIDSAQVPQIDGRILGVIVPHAGYIYSGPVAGYAFKAIEQNKKQYEGNTVILIGFSHRPPNWSGLSVWAKGAWVTPIDTTYIDEALAQKIMSHNPNIFQFRKDVHAGEHSLEIELPFLQVALGKNFKLVPIAFSHQTQTEIDALVSALLASDIDWNKTLLVVSTDMSHYHPYAEANSLDRKTLEFVLAQDTSGLKDWMGQGVDAFCGWGPVLSLLSIATQIGATKTYLLKYANSGDIRPESRPGGVVGYCSVVFVRNETGKSSNNKGNDAEKYSLTDEQKKYLLKLARTTIEKYVKDGKKYEPPKPSDPKLIEDAPVFVTLHVNNMLRGCIGQMVAKEPLYLAVRDMAISSATEDPRFKPVSADELDKIDIEISVLSPMTKVSSWQDVIPGKHGVYIKRGFYSGTFLPQVWEQIPDREAFLSELCSQKAHLESDCYKKPDVEIYVYTVLEFSEKTIFKKSEWQQKK